VSSHNHYNHLQAGLANQP